MFFSAQNKLKANRNLIEKLFSGSDNLEKELSTKVKQRLLLNAKRVVKLKV